MLLFSMLLLCVFFCFFLLCFFFQAEDGIRYLVRSRGLGDVYKRQVLAAARAVRQDPTWAPQGLTNGMMFTIRVSEKMNAAFQKWLLAQQ